MCAIFQLMEGYNYDFTVFFLIATAAPSGSYCKYGCNLVKIYGHLLYVTM